MTVKPKRFAAADPLQTRGDIAKATIGKLVWWLQMSTTVDVCCRFAERLASDSQPQRCDTISATLSHN